MKTTFLLVLTLITTGCSTVVTQQNLEEHLRIAVANTRKKMPYMVSENLRVDTAEAGPGPTLTDRFTFLGQESFAEKKAFLENVHFPKVRERVLADPGMTKLMRMGATVVYSFKDTDGAFLGEVRMSAADLKEKKEEPNQSSQTTPVSAPR